MRSLKLSAVVVLLMSSASFTVSASRFAAPTMRSLSLSGTADLAVDDGDRSILISADAPGTTIAHLASPNRQGVFHLITNTSTVPITIAHETTSTGIITPMGAPYAIPPRASVGVWYDLTVPAWRIVAMQSSEQWTVPLQLFGPACDGETDDSVEIQAAVDVAVAANGTLVWPPVACATATTIVVGGSTEHDTYMSLRGATSKGSQLIWVGEDDGVALKISRNKYFKIEGISVINEAETGTTQGILLTGPFTPNTGTMVVVSRLEDVGLGGFHIGIQAGDPDHGDTSEMMYTNVWFEYNDIGIRFDGPNTLDQKFNLLLCGFNGTCLQNHSSGEIWIDGGAATSNTTDIELSGSAFGVFAVRNFRSEGADRFMTGSVPNLTIESCQITPSTNEDHIVIELDGGQSEYQTYVRSSEIWGYLVLTPMEGSTGSLVVENNRVRSDSDIPVTFVSTGSGSTNRMGNVSARFVNNINAIYGGAYFKFKDYPIYSLQHATPDPLMTVLRANNRERDGSDTQPVDFLQFNRVKVLSEAGYTDGRNLRVLWKFPGSSATTTVTFTRSETVGVTAWHHDNRTNELLGYDTITVASGHFSQGDVGKKIVITGACQSVDCIAVIKSITDATHVVVQLKSGNITGDGFDITNASVSATVGENEPDALYIPIVSCNAQETISWSSLTTTGLTLTSSNSSSTATCAILLLR